MAYDLRDIKQKPSIFPPGQAIHIGQRHTLLRHFDHRVKKEIETEPLAQRAEDLSSRYHLLVGSSQDARKIVIEDKAVHVGTDSDNGLVLYDSAVSRRHCRLEPGARGLRIRDLGSTNGTWVDGVQVLCAQLEHGMRVRVGKTTLYVVRAETDDKTDTKGIDGFVAKSLAMQHVVSEVERFCRFSWPVLIAGPTGVGKESIARNLHRKSIRKNGPFVALNAGGLPHDLMESELFGHEKGAFTGAVNAHKGAFERANGGVLFLDEIGELPLSAQARLLRVLENWEVLRVGGESSFSVDLRLVCATHRDLPKLVEAGEFRADLYYRIARLVIKVPALKERLEELRPLAEHFLNEMRAELGPRALGQDAFDRLCLHHWPGNVREFRNVLCAAAVSAVTPSITAADIDHAFVRLGIEGSADYPIESIEQMLVEHKGNLSSVARALGIPRSTLRDRLRTKK
ncbi:MAG: sigma 54-dependent Fis family transcriptional regulator [Myxococcales bacterium]|nr:MAG: sigma 54-dependent Fis family transcriptional regulator [Myxococcales bacterium]